MCMCMQQALSQQLNAKLSPKQQKEWFKIFRSIDEDGSGRIIFKARYARDVPEIRPRCSL